ncbi:Catalase-like domain, heme-dependent, partial [Metarhizium majus ARSEF 297]
MVGGLVTGPQVSHRIGDTLQGPHLLQDINLMEVIQHVMHERIPERHAHAKGAGAYGVFKVTESWVSNYTDANFLQVQGRTTNLFARFSTTEPERGSADSVRDTRGFAFKLYTDEGNLDWLFLSTPTFLIRDGAKLPSMSHSTKRDPETGLSFMSHNPETFNTIMKIFSDEGTPKTYRDVRIFSINAYKFIKGNSYAYVRIHIIPNKFPEYLTRAEAEKLAGDDPDALTRDLRDEIANARYPSWKVYAQVVEPGQVQGFPVNIFDPTLRWPEDETGAPLREFGEIQLNKNPDDNFAQVEQVSFTPAAIVKGWGLSAGPILQARLLAYGTAARYRLGVNFYQLKVNKPKYAFNPTKRDGIGYVSSVGPKEKNYIVNDAGASRQPLHHEEWRGKIKEHKSEVMDLNFRQAAEVWSNFDRGQQDSFVGNVATNLGNATLAVKERTLDVFGRINRRLEERIRQAMGPLGPDTNHSRAPRNTGGIGG